MPSVVGEAVRLSITPAARISLQESAMCVMEADEKQPPIERGANVVFQHGTERYQGIVIARQAAQHFQGTLYVVKIYS